MTESESGFCDTCPIPTLNNALARAIERVGPTLPDTEIVDAAQKIKGLKYEDSCHVCIPVVLAEGPLVPMIEKMEALPFDWNDFDMEARQVHSFIEQTSTRIKR